MTPLTGSFGMTSGSLRLAALALREWRARQVLVAAGAALGIGLLMGFATVLIPNQVFARDIPTVWWNYPVWVLSSVLLGMLVATYVTSPVPEQARGIEPGSRSEARDVRTGTAAGVLAWFAVGCPVCNKIALLALGYTGALTWFAPLQPLLALVSLVLAAVAVLWRLKGQVSCPLPATSAAAMAGTQ